MSSSNYSPETTSITLFSDWRNYEPAPISPVLAGSICLQKSCPHINHGRCPYWGTLAWTTISITSNEIWQKKGYCPFYAN